MKTADTVQFPSIYLPSLLLLYHPNLDSAKNRVGRWRKFRVRVELSHLSPATAINSALLSSHVSLAKCLLRRARHLSRPDSHDERYIQTISIPLAALPTCNHPSFHWDWYCSRDILSSISTPNCASPKYMRAKLAHSVRSLRLQILHRLTLDLLDTSLSLSLSHRSLCISPVFGCLYLYLLIAQRLYWKHRFQ